MPHFLDQYADRLNDVLHERLGGTLFYKQEIIEVPGLLTAILVTYDGVRDDAREVRGQLSWEAFLERMSIVKPDWTYFDRQIMEGFAAEPAKGMGGWEGRTIYLIKGGQHPEHWTAGVASREITALLDGRNAIWGRMIYDEVRRLPETLPVGRDNFRRYEEQVRIVFRYLFQRELGAGIAQSRTEPENEGVEIRDILFPNVAETGFWQDQKEKYSASEIVVDAKNTEGLTRDDLRQLYCYLKPALGYWGIILCRSQQPDKIHAYNRTLYKNFEQKRGVLILCDDDLRRMTEMALRQQRPSDYMRERWSEFVRSI